MLHQRIRESRAYKRLQEFSKRNERLLMPTMLLAGTTLDAVQFRLLQIDATFLITGIYAVVCAVAMLLMVAAFRPERAVMRYAQLAAPYLQQFTIGALLSTSLLFYWFSGSFSASWPLIGGIALVMVSNEVLRGYFMLPVVQVAVFYFALFSLVATLSAYVFNSLSPWVFVVGGMVSLVVMAGFLVLYIRTGKLFSQRTALWFTVLGIFSLMNIGYFLNFIPPIPLSLRDAGMYYSLTRTNGEYVLVGEDETWFERLIPGQTLHVEAGQPLYAYTAVAAPTQLSTTLVHRWEQYDTESHEWVTASTLRFGMTGGRADGYRGYSIKSNVEEGKWRVSVETLRGQILGRIRFRIQE